MSSVGVADLAPGEDGGAAQEAELGVAVAHLHVASRDLAAELLGQRGVPLPLHLQLELLSSFGVSVVRGTSTFGVMGSGCGFWCVGCRVGLRFC